MSAAARKKPRSRRKQKKTELVYGLGATGLSVARYFAERDIEVRFVDSRENPPGCDELASLLPEADGNIEISGAKNYGRFSFGGTELYSRLLEGPFPDYERVIPKSNPLRAEIQRGDFLASLRRILVLSDSQTRQVKLVLEPSRLQVLAEYQGAGEAMEELPLEYSGEPLTIGYNGGYLLDMLKTFDAERVAMSFQSSVSAGLFNPIDDEKEESLLCLVMPLRLPDAR